MIGKDWKANLQFVWESVNDLFDTIMHPRDKANAILEIAYSDKKEANTRALHIWTTALAISIILQIPLHIYYGVKLNILFFLVSCITQLLFLVVGIFSVYYGLALFKVRIPYNDLFIIYATIIGSYSVFLTIAMFPNQLDSLGAIVAAKKQGMDLIETLKYRAHININNAKTLTSDIYLLYSNLSSNVLLILSSITTVIVSKKIASRYSLPKHKVIEGTVCGLLFVGILFQMFVGVFYYFTLYAFL